MNWEKLCPNLSFSVENKIGNLNRLSKFQTFNKLDIPFPHVLRSQRIGKHEPILLIFHFESIGSSACTAKFLALGKALKMNYFE